MALSAAEGSSARVRQALEQSLADSTAANPDQDYDEITEDVNFSILVFGGCY